MASDPRTKAYSNDKPKKASARNHPMPHSASIAWRSGPKPDRGFSVASRDGRWAAVVSGMPTDSPDRRVPRRGFGVTMTVDAPTSAEAAGVAIEAVLRGARSAGIRVAPVDLRVASITRQPAA